MIRLKYSFLISFLFLLDFAKAQEKIATQNTPIWIFTKQYKPLQKRQLEPAIMSLDEYTSSNLINTHARPYIYMVESKRSNGVVLVFGAEHTKDIAHKQFIMMENEWKHFKPTVSMVEGSYFFQLRESQNPVNEKGESGFIGKMAKEYGIDWYTWEPGRDQEIEFLIKNKYLPITIAAFYCLQSYQNKWGTFSKTEQDSVMKDMISKRTYYKGIKGALSSVEQIDSLWKTDYASIDSWRVYKHPHNGWPDGHFKRIATDATSLRDEHMCRSIIELVNKGEKVFISMGSSHAPRVERTLRGMIK